MAHVEQRASSSPTSEIAPPPWDLAGRGAVVLLRPAAGRRRGLLDAGGALAFVEYSRSGVGPYLELLHVPHFTHAGSTIGPTIDRIWVTSQRSVVSGRANWAIPKDLATIRRMTAPGDAERWEATADGALLARLALRPYGPPLPAVKPRAFGRLLQRMNGERYATPINARGVVRLARLEELELGPIFDDIDPARVVGALSVKSFRMGFHAAAVTPSAA